MFEKILKLKILHRKKPKHIVSKFIELLNIFKRNTFPKSKMVDFVILCQCIKETFKKTLDQKQDHKGLLNVISELIDIIHLNLFEKNINKKVENSIKFCYYIQQMFERVLKLKSQIRILALDVIMKFLTSTFTFMIKNERIDDEIFLKLKKGYFQNVVKCAKDLFLDIWMLEQIFHVDLLKIICRFIVIANLILNTKSRENKKIRKIISNFLNLPLEGKLLFYNCSTLNVENKKKVINSIILIFNGLEESFGIRIKVKRTKKFKIAIQYAVQKFKERIHKSKYDQKQASEKLIKTLTEAKENLKIKKGLRKWFG